MPSTHDRPLGVEVFDDRVVPALIVPALPGSVLGAAMVATPSESTATLERIDVTGRPGTLLLTPTVQPGAIGHEIAFRTATAVSSGLAREANIETGLGEISIPRPPRIDAATLDPRTEAIRPWQANADGGSPASFLAAWDERLRWHPLPAHYAAVEGLDTLAGSVATSAPAPSPPDHGGTPQVVNAQPPASATRDTISAMYAASMENVTTPPAAAPRIADAAQVVTTAIPVIVPAGPNTDDVLPTPSADPLLGLIPIDVSAIEADAHALLGRVEDLHTELAEELLGTEEFAWLTGAVVILGGTTQAVRVYRTRVRAGAPGPGADSVLGRWGIEGT